MPIEGRKDQSTALIQSMSSVYMNYGGLLQAYAMQRVLRDYGVDSITNTSTTVTGSARNFAGSAAWLVKHRTLNARISPRIRRYRSGALMHFAASNVQTTNRRYGASEMQLAVDDFDAQYAIAGSDQVWRPRYADVLAGAFESVEAGRVRKIAYAASFGLGNTREFDSALKERFGRALRDFSFVGVRESSAVEICRAEFGVDAQHVLDPTMLVRAKDWETLATDSRTPECIKTEPYLLYIGLDRDYVAKQESKLLASRLGLIFWELYGPEPVSRKEFRENPASFVLPTVEEWLFAIKNATLVITDSFHVSVFSMMFATSFLVMENPVRGNSRLESLLKMVGLGELQINATELRGIQNLPNIYWPGVQDDLRRKKSESKGFLRRALL